MNTSTQTVALKTRARTGTLTVGECTDRVYVSLTFSRYGMLGDEAEIAEQLARVIVKWEGDGRPVVIRDARSGAVATCYDAGFAIVRPADS